MNLLSLISPQLDIVCQVTTKYATVPKSKHFRELNTTLHLCIDAEVLSLVNYSSPLCSLCAWLRRTCEGS